MDAIRPVASRLHQALTTSSTSVSQARSHISVVDCHTVLLFQTGGPNCQDAQRADRDNSDQEGGREMGILYHGREGYGEALLDILYMTLYNSKQTKCQLNKRPT